MDTLVTEIMILLRTAEKLPARRVAAIYFIRIA
jgi:hypothetical protein